MAKITQYEAWVMRSKDEDKRNHALEIILKYGKVDIYLKLLESNLNIDDYVRVYTIMDPVKAKVEYFLVWKKEK